MLQGRSTKRRGPPQLRAQSAKHSSRRLNLGLLRERGAQLHERDAGVRPGLTTDERARLKDLERENRELKRANEILRKASAYFAQAELDRRAK